MADTLTIVRPDDWHLYLRDGNALINVVGDTARRFGRAVVMSSLKSPVTTTARTCTYREHILAALSTGTQFEPLMTPYLTDNTSPEVIREARAGDFIHGVKLYPAGAITDNDAGVTDLCRCARTLEATQEVGMPLLVHGEITGPTIDIFDRGAVFIDTAMLPLRCDFPALKVVFEHITTKHATEYVHNAEGPVSVAITAHHLLCNRSTLFVDGIRPHYYRLLVLKCETHYPTLVAATTSSHLHFFLGTDSAPRAKGVKEHTCGCAGCYTTLHVMELYAETFEDTNALDELGGFTSLRGPDFYDLPRNAGILTLTRSQWQLPAEVPFGEQTLISLRGGEILRWKSI